MRRVKKKKKKNGNPLSRSNSQSKSVAFNIDESHPSSLNPALQFRNNHPHSFVSLNPFTLTYPQKNANTRRYALRTTLDLGSGRNKGRNWSRSRSRWRNRESDYQRYTYIPIYAEELTTILPREHSRPSGLVMNRKPSPPCREISDKMLELSIRRVINGRATSPRINMRLRVT